MIMHEGKSPSTHHRTAKKLDAKDFLAMFGLICVHVGLYWIYPPLCLIVGGLVLTFLSIVFSVRERIP